MRFSKKLIAMCLAVAMLLTMSISSTLAVSFSDVPDDSPYKTAIDSLVSLGLLVGDDDGNFRPNDTITRAEFAAVMTRAMGQEEVALSGVNSRDLFTDMVVENGQDHWATGYVRVAYNLGIILGMGDGTFDPDAPVTYEQAVKMIVCALGYEPICVDRGGWPDGYIAVANEIGVTKSAVMQPTSQEAPRGMVAKLLHNSLKINMMEKNANGSLITTTKTILSSKLKVTELRNAMVVDVDGVATLNSGTSTVREGELILETAGSESEVYRYDGVLTSVQARDLLGYYVNCYYRYDDTLDQRVLVSVDATEYKNTSISIQSELVDDYSSSRVLSYYEKKYDSKTKDITISSDAKLIYNGAAFNYKNSSHAAGMQDLSYWLDPDSPNFFNGEATLLDAGSDGTIDVVFLYDYQTFVVKQPVDITNPVDDLNYVISDAYIRGKNIRIDPNDPDVNVSIINAADNSAMQIEALRKNDVVSIAQSMDGDTIICYVSRDSIKGSISEVSSDGYYIINNREYELTPEFKAVVSEGSILSLQLNSSGTFYLDRYGKIAGADLNDVQQVGNFGYIASVAEDTSNECLRVSMVFPSSPYSKSFSTTRNVEINDVRYDGDTQGMAEALRTVAGMYDSNSLEGATRTACTQLVRYKLNSKNEISSITTAAVSGDSLDMGTTANQSTLKLYSQVRSETYKGSGKFGGVLTDGNTQILSVPNTRNKADEYRWLDLASFKDGKAYQIEAYNVDNNNIADLILVYGDVDSDSISEETQIGIVAEDVSMQTTSKLDPSEPSVFKLKLYQNNSAVPIEYETDSLSSVYSDLKVGDAIRIGRNGYGQVNEVKVSAKANALVPKVEEEGTFTNGEYTFRTMTGTVVSMTDAFMRVAPAFVDTSVTPPTLDQTDVEPLAIDSNTRFYMVSARKITQLDNANFIVPFNTLGADEASKASKVFSYQYEGDLKMVVIYAD